jgi:hypothetical protein
MPNTKLLEDKSDHENAPAGAGTVPVPLSQAIAWGHDPARDDLVMLCTPSEGRTTELAALMNGGFFWRGQLRWSLTGTH